VDWEEVGNTKQLTNPSAQTFFFKSDSPIRAGEKQEGAEIKE